MSILPEFSFPQFSLPDFSLTELSISQFQIPSVTIFGMTWFYNEEADASAALDLGNGQFLEAPEVLDSHFRRLIHESPGIAALSLGEHVQADNADLTEAIDVLAPSLAPLTHLANDLATSVPQIEPDPAFRQKLQQRLEMAHQQQAERAQEHGQWSPFNEAPPEEDGYAIFLWHYVSEHYVLAGIPVVVGLIACARYFYTKEPK